MLRTATIPRHSCSCSDDRGRLPVGSWRDILDRREGSGARPSARVTTYLDGDRVEALLLLRRARAMSEEHFKG